MILSGDYIFARPGQKCFEIASNFTNYIELGIRGITKYYLEAKIEDNEFKISGLFLNKSGNLICVLNENYAKGSCSKEERDGGYNIKDKDNNLILDIIIDNNICRLKGIIYGASGDVIAQDGDGHFMIIKGPATIGKVGEYTGIYIGKEEILKYEISQNVIKIHSDDLKELLNEWRQGFPQIVLSESPLNCYDNYGFIGGPPLSRHTHPSKDMLFSVENHVLFKDLLYHLVGTHDTFPTRWNNFKQRIINYDNSRYNLYENIGIDIEKHNTAVPLSLFTLVPLSIFTAAISLAKEIRSLNVAYKYNYIPDRRMLEYGTTSEKYNICDDISKDESDKIMMLHQNVSKEYYENFKDIIDEIIDDEIILINARIELINEINDLILYPLLPFHMDCKYVRPLIKNFKGDVDLILDKINPKIIKSLQIDGTARVVSNLDDFLKIVERNGNNEFYQIQVIQNTINGFQAGYNLGIYTITDNYGPKINFIISQNRQKF